MKPVLMIHKVHDWMFDLPLEDYILTFDDGLYSQYHYYPQFKQFNTEKIYFISSGIVSSGEQSSEFPESQIAHNKAAVGNFEDYMTVEQIRELDRDPMVFIGGHGHDHLRLSEMDTMADKIRYINDDLHKMRMWFKENLGYYPDRFCYPHNDDLRGVYRAIVLSTGIHQTYGSERIPIETLLRV